MSFSKIKLATGRVATVTLFNPERRNAIGPQMVNELLHALDRLRADDAVRVVVLTGEGKAFCAGGDFQQMTGTAEGGEPLPYLGDYVDLLLAMTRYEKPIVARVNGHAMGGGLGLVAASHFAIASADAKLGTPEIDVGLFPFMIMAVLARTMPRRALLEMMLRGQKLSAAKAAEYGVLSRAVAAGELDAEVNALCNDLSERAPLAVKLGLRAWARQGDLALEEALPMLRTKLGEALATDDAREGLMAFLEKRTPAWTGK
ncbi:enoyl-CoA hydratase/isomerase family protein [soil metagenome]